MEFKKVGVLWKSPKLDQNGKPFYSGVVNEDITLEKGYKLFVFMTDKRSDKSPVAKVMVGIKEPDFYDTNEPEQIQIGNTDMPKDDEDAPF